MTDETTPSGRRIRVVRASSLSDSVPENVATSQAVDSSVQTPDARTAQSALATLRTTEPESTQPDSTQSDYVRPAGQTQASTPRPLTRPKVINFDERHQEQRSVRMRSLLLKISVSVLSVAIVAFAVWALIFSPWFKVHIDKISISGTQQWVNMSSITKITDPTVGTSLVIVSNTALEKQIDDIPGVGSASVTKVFPHGLKVEVREETPTVLLKTSSGQYVAVDKLSRRIAITDKPADGVPVIEVPTEKSGLRSEAVKQAIAVLASLPADMHASITTTTADSQDSITTALSSGYTVVWGNSSSMPTKLAIVQKTIEQLAAEGDNVHKTIDVSAPSRPIVR